MSDDFTMLKTILDGYTKVADTLKGKANQMEIRSFIAGFLIEEPESEFNTLMSAVISMRKELKKGRQ
jgi:hypothetical protein